MMWGLPKATPGFRLRIGSNGSFDFTLSAPASAQLDALRGTSYQFCQNGTWSDPGTKSAIDGGFPAFDSNGGLLGWVVLTTDPNTLPTYTVEWVYVDRASTASGCLDGPMAPIAFKAGWNLVTFEVTAVDRGLVTGLKILPGIVGSPAWRYQRF